jgi:hypothetical protein
MFLIAVCALIQQTAVIDGSDKPFDLKITGLPTDLRLTCQVGFKDFNFALDTGRSESIVSDGALRTRAEKMVVILGNRGFVADVVPKSDLTTTYPDGTVMGVIGLDAVENMAIGIDYRRATATIWTEGASLRQAEDWMGPALTDSIEIPIKITDGRVLLDASFGGRTLPMAVDTGSTINGLPENMLIPDTWRTLGMNTIRAVEGTKTVPFGFSPDFEVAGIHLPWKPFTNMGELPVISPQACWWPRVLIDFKNRRLFVPPDNRAFDLVTDLCIALQQVVHIEGGKLFVSLEGKPSGDTPAELLSVGTVDMEDLASNLADTNKVFPMICKVYDEVSKGCTLRLKVGDSIVEKHLKIH